MNGPAVNNLRSYKGEKPLLGEQVWIDPSAVVIGDVNIGSRSSLWCNVTARGDVNCIRIGCESNIRDNSVLHVTHKSEANPEGHPLIIGNRVTVGHSVTLHGCTLEDESFVGIGAIILDAAVVQKNCMIGAGTLVTQGMICESGWLYVGAPARKMRQLTADELAWLPKSAANYVAYAADYLANG